MIFVTVGTQKFQFNRLLKIIDGLVEQNIINDKIVCQSGYSSYIPRNYRTIKFMPQDEYDQNILKCKLLITHAGVGTILQAKKYNKKIIVIPRLKKYKEHVDDHQQQIVSGFATKGLVFKSNGLDLGKVIGESHQKKLKDYQFNSVAFTNKLCKVLNELNYNINKN